MTEKELPIKLNRDFKGIWIPREIWLAQGLSPTEKILWAEIHSLYDREKGGCYASNDYLMTFMGVKERRLQEMISNLKAYGLVIQVSFDGRERVIKALVPQEGFVACRAEVQNNAPPPCIIMHPLDAENCTPPIYIDISLEKSIDPPLSPPQDNAAIAAEERVEDSPKSKRIRTPSEFSSKVKDLAEKMVNALHLANPHWLIPKNLHPMMVVLEEMITKEHREPKVILDVFMWAVCDSFWMDKLCKPNPAKYLREKFGQLAGKMNEKPAVNPNQIDRRLKDKEGKAVDDYKDNLF